MKKYLLSSIILLIGTINTVYAQTPTDPYYPYQFYLDMMNVEDAWDITKGDASIIVFILDNGFTFHEGLPSSKIANLLSSLRQDYIHCTCDVDSHVAEFIFYSQINSKIFLRLT